MVFDITTTPPAATATGAPSMAAIAPAWNPADPLNPQHKDWKLNTLPRISSGTEICNKVDNPLS